MWMAFGGLCGLGATVAIYWLGFHAHERNLAPAVATPAERAVHPFRYEIDLMAGGSLDLAPFACTDVSQARRTDKMVPRTHSTLHRHCRHSDQMSRNWSARACLKV